MIYAVFFTMMTKHWSRFLFVFFR